MVKEIVTIDYAATVKAAVDLMNKHAIGCLIVVERGTPVGIVTERDILKRVIPRLEGTGKIRVKQIMSEPLVVGNPDMSVNKALGFLFKKRIKKLPVVEGDRLVGLVTLTDLLRSPNNSGARPQGRWWVGSPASPPPRRRSSRSPSGTGMAVTPSGARVGSSPASPRSTRRTRFSTSWPLRPSLGSGPAPRQPS